MPTARKRCDPYEVVRHVTPLKKKLRNTQNLQMQHSEQFKTKILLCFNCSEYSVRSNVHAYIHRMLPNIMVVPHVVYAYYPVHCYSLSECSKMASSHGPRCAPVVTISFCTSAQLPSEQRTNSKASQPCAVVSCYIHLTRQPRKGMRN